MKNYLLFKNSLTFFKRYIFIISSIIIFLFFLNSKSFSEENLFTIKNVKVKGTIDINFSRDKYLNRAFSNSFDILMNRILLTRDLKKVSNINLKQIQQLINSFQIIEESYRMKEYRANIKIFYNEQKIKDFLGKKNISFSQPESISAVFFPILFIDDNIQSFNDNYFYKEWSNQKIKNEIINFVLPIEDIDDIHKIKQMKDKIEAFQVEEIVNKYNIESYAFTLMDYQKKKLNIHLKTNFNDNKVSKNFTYNLENINDELALNSILKDLKLKITDLWKEENLVNILMPLAIQLKFEHKNLKNLEKIRNSFYKINIINNYTLEEFDINNSFFKIYYYGNPKKLRSELLKFGYLLKNNQGSWQIYLNE